MINSKDKQSLLFETSWEVCNKVGGIYAVLSTKVKTLQKKFDDIIFIGPDVWSDDNPSPYFIESKTLLKEWRNSATLPSGMSVRIGRWNIPGKPIVILVNYKPLFSYKDQLYAEMWNRFGVDSIHAYGDYDDSCMFSYGAALVIESICLSKNAESNYNTIAHFDEWTTGMGLLYIKKHMPQIATVFTTHATSIGRSICGNNKPLYDFMSGYNGDQMANELNMQSKHSLEKAAAWNADSFTTVSDVTAKECEQLLERRPIVTPNGFEQTFVPTKKDYAAKRDASRRKLLAVASALTGQKLDQDTFIIATSGRNEFRNKGLDVFIDSVNVLRTNWTDKTRKLVAFIMVPAWVDIARKDLIEELSKKKHTGLENTNITHSLHNYSQDSIYGKLNYLGMNNLHDDNVITIYVPSYLNGSDGIFDMSYYDLLPGFDCTVFASYYEPWGYTPLESIAFGVPTITTDLAGFGQWILADFANEFDKTGVRVVHRSDSNYSNAVRQIADDLKKLLFNTNKYIADSRKAASLTSKAASWNFFMAKYEEAYSEALKNVQKCGTAS